MHPQMTGGNRAQNLEYLIIIQFLLRLLLVIIPGHFILPGGKCKKKSHRFTIPEPFLYICDTENLFER